MRKIFLAAMSLLALSACNKSGFEAEEVVNPNGRLVTVGVSAPSGGAETRASLTDNGSSWKIQWNKGDALGGWQNGTTISEFTMGAFSDVNGKNAEFSGMASVSSGLRMIYPYDGTTLATAGKYPLDMKHQTVDMEAPLHRLSKKMYMVSERLTISSENTVPYFRMQPVNSILQIKPTFRDLNTITTSYRIIRIEVGGTAGGCIGYPITGILDLTATDISITNSSDGVLRANVENSPELTNSEYTVNVASLPFEMNASNKLQIKVIVEQQDKTTEAISYVAYTQAIEATASYNFERGKYHFVKITCLDSNKAGYTFDSWAGSGTSEQDPYLISNRAELALLATNVNDGTDYAGKYFKMTGDIDLQGSESNQWTAIGTTSNQFNGTIDGAGRKVTGLYINKSTNYQGLFSYVGSGGVIKNLGVDGSVKGGSSVGGVAGCNAGIIDNCYNIGSVVGGFYTGGVAGWNNKGTLTNCYNTGSVKGETAVGGVAGWNNKGNLTNCYNTGSVTGLDNVGGVAGQNDGNLTNCYNTGSVTGLDNVGGVAGQNDAGTLKNNYYLIGCATINGSNPQGGVGSLGNSPVGDVLGQYDAKTDTELKESTFSAELNTNAKDYNTTVVDKPKACGWYGVDGALPTLAFGSTPDNVPDPSTATWTASGVPAPNFGGGTGTETNPFLITSAYELARISEMANGLNGKTSTDFTGVHFRLTNDINLSGKEWTAIGTTSSTLSFKGTFDGTGHKITGLYINKPTTHRHGLFGCIGNGGMIKNLSVDGSVNGNEYVGGIAGVNLGSMINCYNTASVRGIYIVGGVVGDNNSGTMINCYNTASVVGPSHVGGMVGENNGTMTNCYNTASIEGNTTGGVAGVNAGTMTNCYNTGSVRGTYNLGGLAGWNDGSLTNSYNTGSVVGDNTVGGVTGLTTSNTITNTYYLAGCAKAGATEQGSIGSRPDVPGQYEAKTDTQLKHADFATILNTNAATYNVTNASKPKACQWRNNSTSSAYPTLILGTIAN